MKNFLTFGIMLLLTITLAGCGDAKAQQESTVVGSVAVESRMDSGPSTPTSRSLIVYFSHSGNTRELARQIQQRTGADVLELRTVTPYTTVYNDLTQQVKRELENAYRPALQPINVKLENYDTIFLGSPIWWGTVATPISSFLATNNLSGKVIKPFVTHGGSGLARSIEAIKSLCPQADVRQGLAIHSRNVNSSQNELAAWIGEK